MIAEDFIPLLVRKRAGISERNAALVAAVLLGVGVLRDVVGVKVMAEEEGGEIEGDIAGLIASLLSGRT
ncbi:hypothetical protein D2T30_13420 [Sinirhodobacter populi]|uniref:Uncharacterized protein n=1 Tax=Paenirhodobacter populi TaxID=2306993 RepID=A0A443JG21_9RHOB|nr:hypothetical protein D2T30_13420 [Sinirhodobacter populi]